MKTGAWLWGAALSAHMVLAGCGGGGGGGSVPPPAPPPTGKSPSSIVASAEPAPPTACPTGGITVRSGIDTNGNGVLDVAEVTSTQYVCNGTSGANGGNGTNGTNGVNGLNVLLTTTLEPSGANCASGGTKISGGQDINLNGVLESAEVTSTAYVCNGSNGTSGSNGSNGTNGINGANGSNGLNSLMSIVLEPAGTNCPNAGLKLTTGLDANGNNVLDAAEVSTTSYMCNSANGGTNGFNSITASIREPAGANCPNGGIRIGSGLDANRNNILDVGEVTTTSYVCNGLNGTNGANGTNGTNGTNGLTSLSMTVSEPAGANCTFGGLKLTSGLDINANNVLDASEITSTNYVCNGGTGSGMQWITVTSSSQLMTSNTGYLANNDVTQVILTLPAAPVIGDTIEVTGVGKAGWKIAQNINQTIMTKNLSPEAGVTWSPRNITGSWSAMSSSADGMRLVAATGFTSGHFSISSDAGSTWTTNSTVTGDWSGLASSADGSKLVATMRGGQIYTSTDFGANWVARDVARAWEAVASSTDGTKLVAVVNGGQLFTSTNSGVTWVPRDVARTWHAVASNWDGSKLVAAVSNGQIYTSTDSGVNWTARDAGRLWSAVASSEDGVTLFAGTSNGLMYTSTDSGVTWTPRDSVRFWTSIACSVDGKQVVASTNGNLYTSNDFGASWTPRDSARDWRKVTSSADGSRLAAAVFGVQIYTSQPSTTPGVNGSIAAGQYDAIKLQYIGADTFTVLSHEGNLVVQ